MGLQSRNGVFLSSVESRHHCLGPDVNLVRVQEPGEKVTVSGMYEQYIHAYREKHSYFSNARNAAGSTSGSSISVDVVAMPPLNMASNTALPAARTNLQWVTLTLQIIIIAPNRAFIILLIHYNT